MLGAGTKVKAERISGVRSDLGRGRALRVDRGKQRRQSCEMRARSRHSRVGHLLPLDQVKDLFKIGRSISIMFDMTSLKAKISKVLDGNPFLSFRDRRTLKSSRVTHKPPVNCPMFLSSR